METTLENHGLLKRIQIVVVNDDSVSLKVITRILSTFQCEVLPFDDVYEALCTLREQRGKFDLLLLEICLIGSKNFDMLKHFVNELDLPIITMCAYDDDKIRHESLHHGACLHLTKPITITDLGVVSQKAWFQREHKEERSESVGSQPNVEEVGQAGASSSSKTPKAGSFGKNEFIWKMQEGGGSEKPKKTRLEWDVDLHQRFFLAAALVGERAPPSRIYELMGVEGLTLNQVSNRLQRHRTHLRRLGRSTEIHPLREIRPMPSFTQPIFAPFVAAPYPPMHSSGWTQPVDMTDKSPPAADDIDDIFDVRNYVFDEAAIAKMLDEITRENDTTP